MTDQQCSTNSSHEAFNSYVIFDCFLLCIHCLLIFFFKVNFDHMIISALASAGTDYISLWCLCLSLIGSLIGYRQQNQRTWESNSPPQLCHPVGTFWWCLSKFLSIYMFDWWRQTPAALWLGTFWLVTFLVPWLISLLLTLGNPSGDPDLWRNLITSRNCLFLL